MLFLNNINKIIDEKEYLFKTEFKINLKSCSTKPYLRVLCTNIESFYALKYNAQRKKAKGGYLVKSKKGIWFKVDSLPISVAYHC